MSFVRLKTITKKTGKTYQYYYLVSNKRVDGKVCQKVEKYFGRENPTP
jgi:hypothetical protein